MTGRQAAALQKRHRSAEWIGVLTRAVRWRIVGLWNPPKERCRKRDAPIFPDPIAKCVRSRRLCQDERINLIYLAVPDLPALAL